MTLASSASPSRLALIAILTSVTLVGHPSASVAQQPVTAREPLTLGEAWARAESKSDELVLAGARQDQALGNAREVGSSRRPHLNAYSAYDRTLRTEFSGFGGFATDSTTSSQESAEVPFGSAHAYRAGLTASYMVFSGGRSLAESRAAASGRRAAEIGITTTRAQVRLDVAQAYYDAMLADHLSRIAEWTLEQAESTYRRVVLLNDAGRAPEFDVVRAKAARDRERPVLIQRQADQEIARLRLRQLMHLPAGQELTLPTNIVAAALATPTGAQSAGTPIGTGAARTAVREAEEMVRRGEQLLQASQAGRIPAVSLTSTYERVAYPLDGSPSWK